MTTFLNNISSVISFLLSSLGQVTNTLTNNLVFQIAVGLFIFTIVVNIIGSFIHFRKNNSGD